MHAGLDKTDNLDYQVNDGKVYVTNLTPIKKTDRSETIKQNGLKLTKNSSISSKKVNEFGVVYFLLLPKNQDPKSITVHDFNYLKTKTDELFFVVKDAKFFLRYVKMQAEIVGQEVKTTREIQSKEKRWMNLKNAFQARLDYLNARRQKNL